VHLGDVDHVAGDVYGDGVNIAARLMPLSPEGGIALSSVVHMQVRQQIDLELRSIGMPPLKNIAAPLEVFVADPPAVQALGRRLLEVAAQTAVPAAAPVAPPARRRAWVPPLAAAGVVLLGLALAFGVLHRRPSAGPASTSAPPAVAVLPFANTGGDPANEYFSDGLSEELINTLGRVNTLKVIGRTSSEIVRNSDAIVAARKLGVERVVTGSVRRSSEMIRVAAQLVSGRDGVELWSQAYDRPAGDILRIQSDIAQSVADALSVKLGGAVRGALAAGGTENATAHDLYVQAIALRRQGHNEANFRAAIKLFDAAIESDPKFADAYAQKAETLADLTGVYSNTASEFDRGYSEAAVIARRAIALAPHRALGHSALANALGGKLDVRGALAEYQRAFASFAGETEVLGSYSIFMSHIGNSREGLAAADRAISLDPLNPRSHAMRASALFYARRYAEAAVSFRAVMERARVTPVMAYVGLANCLLLQGKTQDAQREYANAPADNVYRLTGEAILAALSGDRDGANRKLEVIREKFGDSAVYQQAQILAQLGQRDRALAALERSWQVRDPGMLGMRADPFVDPVRDDPRFAALERKLGLP
jgi:serine/threonine-protein kinase